MSFTNILRARAKKNQTGRVSDKLTPYQIILGPVFTEKIVNAHETQGKYAFKVHKDANKIDVKQAIQTIYDVEVGSINIMRVPTK
jgi:large subunit ribosomal protein L23